MQKINHIIYHGGCPDGCVGAWVLSCHYPEANLVSWKHNDPLPALDGVLAFVDICPSRDVINNLTEQTEIRHIIILDHHKSAQRDLEGLVHPKLQVVFDMNRSGCRIAWDFLHNRSPPWWLLAVEAGDLWRHSSIDNCKELLSALHFYEYLTTLDGVRRLAVTDPTSASLLPVGQYILQYRAQSARNYAKKYVMMKLTDPNHQEMSFKVAVGTGPLDLRSEVGNLLSQVEGCDFAAVVTFDPLTDQIWLSLRASEESASDLSIVSKKVFGGGGHPKAAGASINRADWALYFTKDYPTIID